MIGQIIQNGEMTIKNNESDVIVRALCEDSLKSYLVYLNPHRAINVLIRFCERLEAVLGVHFKNTTAIRIIVHTAFAIERAITGDALKYKGERSEEQGRLLEKVKTCAEDSITKDLRATLVEDELYYLVDLLLDEFNAHGKDAARI